MFCNVINVFTFILIHLMQPCWIKVLISFKNITLAIYFASILSIICHVIYLKHSKLLMKSVLCRYPVTSEVVFCWERDTFEMTRDACRCPDMFQKANANVNL